MHRFIADLQCFAIVHRSIVWCMRTPAVTTRECRDDGSSMDVDGCVPCRRTVSKVLVQQDELLVKRLWSNLMEHGCQPVSFEDITPLVWSTPCMDPVMMVTSLSLCLESFMDVDVDPVLPHYQYNGRLCDTQATHCGRQLDTSATSEFPGCPPRFSRHSDKPFD
jgi:hypothetical protein